MKFKFLSIAFMAIAFAAIPASAQNKSDKNSTCNLPQCENPANCNPEQCKDPQNCIAGPAGQFNPKKGFLYEGLNLTDEQKEKLSQLDSRKHGGAKKQAQEKKGDKQKGDRKKGDKMQKPDFKMRNDSARIAGRNAAKKQYLEEVKAIVGPDNYVIFLENYFVNGGTPAPMGRHDRHQPRR